MRSNREYDYFGNVLEYEYDYFPSYSSTSTSTQKVLVLEYEYEYEYKYEYEYTSTITPSLLNIGIELSQVSRYFDISNNEPALLTLHILSVQYHSI